MRKTGNLHIFLLIGIVALVLLTGASFSITKQQLISQQKAIIGSLYEKDPEACALLLTAMFENTAAADAQEKGESALIELGYTSQGLDYLYQENEIQRLHTWMFALLIVVAAGTMALFLWLEQSRRKEEERLAEKIGRCIAAEAELDVSGYSMLSPTLTHEISKLLKEIITKELSLKQGNQRTQNFVENIAHQIKTPLACVSISMDLLSEKVKSVDEKEYIRQSFIYLKEIEVLMKKLLDIGRLESGKILMRKVPLQLENLIKESIMILDVQEERFVLEAEREEGISPNYYGDYDWLKEAFANILKNCMEHDNSGKKIVVKLVHKKEHIFIQIRDHGDGFREQDLAHIFDRFYLPEAAKKSHTGIGLNLAKMVIEKHFGEIKAANHAEGGAVFSILFPLYELKDEKIFFPAEPVTTL